MSNYVLIRIEALQQELENLQQLVLHETQGEKRPTQLKGLWQGVQFSETDFDAARRAVFKDAYDE
ncbi:MAG: hypothetical protein DCF32_16950 [Leptolyngbya sp.]|nr:MAG: hypothetical protein DCF32_16950 [Leptolyngbya sp.]